MARITLTVNGRPREVDVDAGATLLAVLRDTLQLTGTKYGCGEGQCGACTVLVGGAMVESCMLAAADVGSREVVTIEGLMRDGKLHPLQRAFLDTAAFQCGFCTPGMIMAAAALLAKNPKPTEEDIRRHLEGNVCRCGTHPRIVEAVGLAARTGGSRG